VIISRSVLFGTRNVSNKVAEAIKTRFLCSVTFIRTRTVREIMWKNTVELDRLQMKIWLIRIACWLPNATNTHLGYVIIINIPLQQPLHERASMLGYKYFACLVSSVFYR